MRLKLKDAEQRSTTDINSCEELKSSEGGRRKPRRKKGKPGVRYLFESDSDSEKPSGLSQFLKLPTAPAVKQVTFGAMNAMVNLDIC